VVLDGDCQNGGLQLRRHQYDAAYHLSLPFNLRPMIDGTSLWLWEHDTDTFSSPGAV
jgi:hypothetical protein